MEKQLQKRRGQWLEAFLNPATKVEEDKTGYSNNKRPGFRTLAESGFKILGITEKYDHTNDPAFMALDKILSASDAVKKEYIALQRRTSINRKIIKSSNDPLKLGLLFSDRLEPLYNSAYNFYRSFLDPLWYQDYVLKIFQALSGTDKPWGSALYDYFETIFNNKYGHEDNVTEDKKMIISSSPIIQNYFPVLENYYKVAIDVNHQSKTVNVYHSILLNNYFFVYGYPWAEVCSTISIDFLRYGGKDRFIICERCGSFAFVERSGKRFCSDICRTTTNNKQRKDDIH